MPDISGYDAHEPTDDLFDADAYIAEGNRKPFRFRFGGDVYELAWSPDIRAVASIHDGDLLGALEAMLGAEQWEQLTSSPQVLDAFTLKEILDRYADHAGVDLPNLPGSTTSSKNTRAPSKPTFNASTARR